MARTKKSNTTTSKESFDVRTHLLVPKHSKLTEKEKKEFLEKQGITVLELPKISIKDPAIANEDFKVGDVLKIERDSPTAGKTVYYRGISND